MVRFLFLKVIVRLGSDLVDLPVSVLMVVHSLLVFDLWVSDASRWSFHSWVRWSWMSLLMVVFWLGSDGSL